MNAGEEKCAPKTWDIVFVNEYDHVGNSAYDTLRNVYKSDVPVNAIEMNILQIIEASRGTALWKGTWPYMAHFMYDSPGMPFPIYGLIPGSPLRYYETLLNQNLQAQGDGRVWIMLRTVNPQDNPLYTNMDFAPLPNY